MSLSAAIIDALLSAGGTAEQLAAIVKADLAERDEVIAAKRAKDAERQRRHRLSRNVTVTPRDARDTPLDKETPPKPPKEIKPPLPPTILTDCAPQADQVSISEVVETWNQLATECDLPKVVKLTASRRKRLSARIREFPDEGAWQRAFATIHGSPFLRGANDRCWKADFDFLLQDKSFTKLVEGSYGA